MIQTDVLLENLCNKGFHIIDNFLNLETYQALRAYSIEKNHQDQFRQAKIGRQILLQEKEEIRSDKIMWIDQESSPTAVQTYIDALSHLALVLNQNLYLGLSELEMHFAVYTPGTFYKRHVDQFTTSNTRKISCVYYLNEDWQEAFQGELILYDKENTFIQKVYPVGNRLVCFNSELPHEVSPTAHTRYSITAWIKTRSEGLSTSVLPRI